MRGRAERAGFRRSWMEGAGDSGRGGERPGRGSGERARRLRPLWGKQAEGKRVLGGIREHGARRRGLLLLSLSLRLLLLPSTPQGAGDSREGNSPHTTPFVAGGGGFGTRPTKSFGRAAWLAI